MKKPESPLSGNDANFDGNPPHVNWLATASQSTHRVCTVDLLDAFGPPMCLATNDLRSGCVPCQSAQRLHLYSSLGDRLLTESSFMGVQTSLSGLQPGVSTLKLYPSVKRRRRGRIASF